MTDTTTIAPIEGAPAFLAGFARMHAAMRRDVDRLSHAVGLALGPDLLRWYRHFRSTIEHHHEREDAIIWPELVRRDPSFEAARAELFADHQVLDTTLAAVETALAAGDVGEARRAAEQLAGVLVEHLAREEAAAFGRLSACFTAEEWAGVERSLLKGTNLAHLAFEIPWVLDGLPDDEAAELEAGAPAVLRVLHRLVFAPRYTRLAAPVLAVAR